MFNIENVNHPKHYNGCSDLGRQILSHSTFPTEYFECECILVIEILKLDFCIGNAIKYLWRLGNKKTWWKRSNSLIIEDIKKAKWYLERYLLTNYELGYENSPWADSLHTSIIEFLIENFD